MMGFNPPDPGREPERAIECTCSCAAREGCIVSFCPDDHCVRRTKAERDAMLAAELSISNVKAASARDVANEGPPGRRSQTDAVRAIDPALAEMATLEDLNDLP